VIDASIPEETTTPMDHDRQLRHTKLESPGQPRMRPIYLGFVALAIVVTHRLTRPDESGLDAHTKTTDVPVIGESRSGEIAVARPLIARHEASAPWPALTGRIVTSVGKVIEG
jgi:hypothetical protein